MPESRPPDWETVGRKRLAQSIRDLVMGDRTVEPFYRILESVEAGEEPDIYDLELARFEIGQLEEVLDDVCKAYGVPRWKTGITFGEMTEEEWEEYQEHRPEVALAEEVAEE